MSTTNFLLRLLALAVAGLAIYAMANNALLIYYQFPKVDGVTFINSLLAIIVALIGLGYAFRFKISA